jgi:hypothetical protein
MIVMGVPISFAAFRLDIEALPNGRSRVGGKTEELLGSTSSLG